MKRIFKSSAKLAAASLLALAILPVGAASAATPSVTPTEARAIAKEAYIYGYPLVDNYRVQYAYYVDKNNPEFMAPWNHIKNIHNV